MKKSNKFSPEVRERAVRMVQEHRGGVPIAVGSH
jgi:transposase-like protein